MRQQRVNSGKVKLTPSEIEGFKFMISELESLTLSDWEEKFVNSIEHQITSGFLTPAQTDKLTEIYERKTDDPHSGR